MDKHSSYLIGWGVGMIIAIVLHGFIDCSVKSDPAYYKEYYSDKKECERLLPRNQECYTVITWETREVKVDTE